jgi:hypothetical protein
MDDDNAEVGTVCGMKIGRGNRCGRRKPAPVPFCPLKIPNYSVETKYMLLSFHQNAGQNHRMKLKIRLYPTIILPVVLYGYETLSPTLREEHRLRVVGNSVLSRIFWSKRDQVTEGGENWPTRSFITRTLCRVYYNDHVEEDDMGSGCSTNGERRNAYRILG